MKGEEDTSTDPDSFSQLKPWKKLIVFLAGAFMNLILGLLCITIIATFMIDCDITTKVSDFVPITLESGETVEPLSNTTGLMQGDEIFKINGNRTHDTTDIQYELALANKEAVDVEVIRNGKHIVLENVKFPCNEIDDLKALSMDFRVLGEEKTFVGTVKYIGNNMLAVIKMVYRSLTGLITGQIPASSMSGIVGVTATVSESMNAGMSLFDTIYYFLYLAFVLTINIGLFNVLPIPALDGGQSCACIFEMITKKKIPEKVYQTVTTVFFILLLVLMAVITLKDVINLF